MESEKIKTKKKQQLIWNCIRVLKGFDVQQVKIVLLGDKVSDSLIKGYLAILVRVGYLVKTSETGYKLIKNIGGRAPEIIRENGKNIGIHDFNINEFVAISIKNETRKDMLEGQLAAMGEFKVDDLLKGEGKPAVIRNYLSKLVSEGKVERLRHDINPASGYRYYIYRYKGEGRWN